jgi:hypothetical protein
LESSIFEQARAAPYSGTETVWVTPRLLVLQALRFRLREYLVSVSNDNQGTEQEPRGRNGTVDAGRAVTRPRKERSS